jgi:hypothetical protein
MSDFGVKLSGNCYLQLTDMSRLSAAKLYRGFESLSLRHAVRLRRSRTGMGLKIDPELIV